MPVDMKNQYKTEILERIRTPRLAAIGSIRAGLRSYVHRNEIELRDMVQYGVLARSPQWRVEKRKDGAGEYMVVWCSFAKHVAKVVKFPTLYAVTSGRRYDLACEAAAIRLREIMELCGNDRRVPKWMSYVDANLRDRGVKRSQLVLAA